MMLAASVPPVVATPEPPKPPFFIYTVQEGDTVGGLASRFGIASTSILWNNLDLENADSLSLGQQLRVPNSDGIIYEVRLGDTLTDIAGYFGANVQDVCGLPRQQPDATSMTLSRTRQCSSPTARCRRPPRRPGSDGRRAGRA